LNTQRVRVVLLGVCAVLALVAGCTFHNLSPIAHFTASAVIGAAPLTIELDASGSSDPDGDILCYVWDFDTADTHVFQGQANATYTFAVPGAYDVSLTVRDTSGHATSVAERIIVTEREFSPEEELVLIDWQLVHDTGGPFEWYVKGRAINTTQASLAHGGVSANFYDATNNLLGSGIDIVFGIEAGAVWEFRVAFTLPEGEGPSGDVDHAVVFISSPARP
jgi:PKD repeat protein